MKKVGEEERIYPRWVPEFEGHSHPKTIPTKFLSLFPLLPHSLNPREGK
jgi:hypothetical protein